MSLQLTLGVMATERESFLFGVLRTKIASEIGIIVQLSSPLCSPMLGTLQTNEMNWPLAYRKQRDRIDTVAILYSK